MQFFVFDPAAGNRTVLSGSGVGIGPAFSQLSRSCSIARWNDCRNGCGSWSRLLVNSSTGNRTVLSSSSVGTGTTFTSPCGIAETWQGDLLVVDKSTATVFGVNRNTGNRTVVSSVSTAVGPYIESSPEFVTTAPPLKLAFPERLVGGTAQFNLFSPIGRQCVIEVSSNLTEWTQLTNFNNDFHHQCYS